MTKRADSKQGSPDLLLEVTPRQVSGDLAPRKVVPEDFRQRAAEIAESVQEVADEFRTRLARLIKNPSNTEWGLESIEIGFDITVQAEAGVLIAKASTGATFSAKLTLKAPLDPQ
ncbi:hypothetical protein [Amycolatopsis sp. NPDC059657]|uniref:hypothetical protein n=1 Tax=Amycolatopsis sp. NPDC059657 TaxID=3346899 RepID=UPI00366FF1FB